MALVLCPAGRGGLPQGWGSHLPRLESLVFPHSVLVTMKASSGLVLQSLSTLSPHCCLICNVRMYKEIQSS